MYPADAEQMFVPFPPFSPCSKSPGGQGCELNAGMGTCEGWGWWAARKTPKRHFLVDIWTSELWIFENLGLRGFRTFERLECSPLRLLDSYTLALWDFWTLRVPDFGNSGLSGFGTPDFSLFGTLRFLDFRPRSFCIYWTFEL